MDKAKRLIRESGTIGAHVTFWYTAQSLSKVEAEYFVQLLRELGFPTDLRSIGNIEVLRRNLRPGPRNPDRPRRLVRRLSGGLELHRHQLTCDSYKPETPLNKIINASVICQPGHRQDDRTR